MKRYLMPMAVMLAGCSAEMSATTPAPNASYVAPRNVTEAEAGATATQVCGYYHSEPAVRAGNQLEVARHLAVAAEREEPLLLERTQKHRLLIEPKLTNFV